MLRIALLHLAPKVGHLRHNELLVRSGLLLAAELGAEWVVTPELCISGYDFVPYLGTGWMNGQPDAWVGSICELAKQLALTVFLGHAERDSQTGLFYNAVFAIGPTGAILGRHRKRAVIPVVEAWATRHENPSPIAIPSPPLRAGVLICADAYAPHLASRLREQGADILISSAAWGPYPHGPENSWEDRSRETGLPLFVCNRTGADHTLDFCDAESVVVMNGKRLLSFKSADSAVVYVEWDFDRQALIRYSTHRLAADAVSADAVVPVVLP